MRILVEACVESALEAEAAQAAGADRIELCRELDVGGTTPLPATVAQARRALTIPLHVLIRPRGGNFHYQGDDTAAMCQDIVALAALGVDGVVLGALDGTGRIDVPVTRRLMEAAQPLPVTFHRAFDAARDPFEALATLQQLRIPRVLSSGQAMSATAGIPLLAELVRRAGPAVTILAGGGIRAGNVRRIVEGAGVREIHLRAGPGGEWIRQVRATLTPPAPP